MTTAAMLNEHTCKALAQMAKSKGVVGWHSMRKDQLVRALLNVSRSSAPSSKNGHAAKNGSRSRANASDSRRAATKASAARRTPKTSRSNGEPARPAQRSTTVMRRIKQMQQQREKDKNLAYRTAGDKRPEPRKDRLVLLVRDPYWLHACWELQRQSVERAAAALGQHWHTATPVVRLLKVFADGAANNAECVLRDIEIHGGVNNWYIDVDEPPCSYRLEIGYLAANDHFHSLARSNIVTTPKAGDKDAIDENWTDVARNCEQVYAMSGGYDTDSPNRDLRELFEERLRRPMGSPLAPRYGLTGETMIRNERDFFFNVEAEMIVYGATKPNARVTLRGEPVELREDGSFTVRLSMPDRRQVIPVTASTADGHEQRTTVIAVERNTKVMEALIRDAEDPNKE